MGTFMVVGHGGFPHWGSPMADATWEVIMLIPYGTIFEFVPFGDLFLISTYF